jgi:TP901 family phage tail tape measure protein
MAKKTTYELELKLGASASASWKTTLSQAEQGLDGFNSLSNKITAGIAAGVTAAAATATAAISSAVDTYKGFEQEMATVKSISEATEAEYTAMKEAALDAGRGTIYTAEESASALEYMSLAGWSVQDSIQGLTPMLQMAAATGAELQTTSDLVTDSMSALGLGVDGLNDYMDKLVTTNNNANTTSEQLMEALVKTGGASRVLGASLDDTITSLGIMANNGSKAEEAGTALNAIMVRMAGNTQAISELDNLGVRIWDDNGEFIGWKESLQLIDGALSDLTDEQRALSLKKIAGTNHYSQFEYLLEGVREAADGTESAWDLLEEQVEDSNGSLRKMYETTTNTLEYAEAKLNSAKQDMQIRFVDVFSDDARDFVNWLAARLPEVTDSLTEFAEVHKRELADALEGVEDGIESLWENGINALSWIVRNKSAITGTIKAVAVQIAAVKAAHTGIQIAKFLTNPLSAGLTVFTLGAAAIGALAGHLEDLAEAAKDAYLENSFGNIALSLSEIESVASQIVGSESLSGVLDALEEFSELDQYQDKIDEAVDTLNKYKWKVSIGLELSEDEAEDYKSAIESYSKAAQDYALQEQYAVQLSLSLAYDEGNLEDSNIVTKVNAFYSDKYDELSALGTSLNEAITDAFNDGLLEIDEIEKISEIQRQMAEIQSKLAAGQMEAQLALFGQEYSGIKLDVDSYENLERELSDQVSEAMDTYSEAFVKNYQAITSAYDNGNGTLTEDEYNTAIADLNKEYANQKAQTEMKALTFELNTINESYGTAYEQAIKDAIDKYDDSDTEWSERPQQLWESIISEITDGKTGNALRGSVEELLENMQPTIESLYDLAEEDWDSLDEETQAAVSAAIENVKRLQSIADGTYISNTLSEDIANQILDEADDDSNIKKFVNDYYGDLASYAKPVIDEGYTETVKHLLEVYNTPIKVSANVDIGFDTTYDTGTLNAMDRYYGTTYNASKYFDIKSNAKGGIYNSPILTTFAEESPEAAIPIDGTPRAKDLWLKTGKLLGTYPTGEPYTGIPEGINTSGSATDTDILNGISTNGNTTDTDILNGISGGIAGRDAVILKAISTDNGSRAETASGGIQVSYSPAITIQGSASKEDVKSAMSLSLDELRDMILEIQRENNRVSFG